MAQFSDKDTKIKGRAKIESKSEIFCPTYVLAMMVTVSQLRVLLCSILKLFLSSFLFLIESVKYYRWYFLCDGLNHGSVITGYSHEVHYAFDDENFHLKLKYAPPLHPEKMRTLIERGSKLLMVYLSSSLNLNPGIRKC